VYVSASGMNGQYTVSVHYERERVKYEMIECKDTERERERK